MSYGVPTHGNGYQVDPQLTAQVRAQLAGNQAFQAWAKGYQQLGRTDVMAAPVKFGISLPQGAWINANGEVMTSPGFVSYALSPKVAWPLYAAAGVGALGSGGAFTPQSYVANEVNGVENSIYSGLGTAAATGAGAGAAAGAGGSGGDAAAAGAGGIANFLKDPKTYASLAGLLTTLATRPNSGGSGNGDVFSQNPQLQHLLDVSSQRVDRTDPLHQAVTQLAMNRLPTNVQR